MLCLKHRESEVATSEDKCTQRHNPDRHQTVLNLLSFALFEYSVLRSPTAALTQQSLLPSLLQS